VVMHKGDSYMIYFNHVDGSVLISNNAVMYIVVSVLSARNVQSGVSVIFCMVMLTQRCLLAHCLIKIEGHYSCECNPVLPPAGVLQS
jgi:hypothetical protein